MYILSSVINDIILRKSICSWLKLFFSWSDLSKYGKVCNVISVSFTKKETPISSLGWRLDSLQAFPTKNPKYKCLSCTVCVCVRKLHFNV